MSTIAHISDSHFGAEDPALVSDLEITLSHLNPDIVALSGDLTQRATKEQFICARNFLDRLGRPTVVVPGNHDIPLYNLVLRAFAPFKRYMKYIGKELEPLLVTNEEIILGLNTTRPERWKSGEIDADHILQLAKHFEGARSKFRVLIAHHHFAPDPNNKESKPLSRSEDAVEALIEREIDLILTGHLHRAANADFSAHHAAAKRGVVLVQAGTCVSRRTREEENSFNFITLRGENIQVEVFRHNGKEFSAAEKSGFRLEGNGWIRT